MCAVENLSLFLDSKLNFNDHLDNKIRKCHKIIGIMKWLSLPISRNILLTVYKSFVKLHLDNCDIIYDQPYNDSSKKN